MIKEALNEILNGKDLSFDMAKNVMEEMTGTDAIAVQIASFLTAMRLKGETIDEITAGATILREKCLKINPKKDVLDIVGTGGDGLNTFNISTITALVVSATGINVAKHGNHGTSSKCGTADVLETLGVNINLSPKKNEILLEKIGICFMLASIYHPSMKNVALIRKSLGIRTIFNILGPLVNPANAQMQLLGVYDEKLVEPLAKVLSNLGVKKIIVVHGNDGSDEITLSNSTKICEVIDGEFKNYTITPEQFGLKKCKLEELVGGESKENAEIVLNILNGREKGAKRDTILLNSAFCLYLSDNSKSINDYIKIATEIIDSGKAINKLNEFIKISNEV
jgi:anthranilate phosphoribosyltransferase